MLGIIHQQIDLVRREWIACREHGHVRLFLLILGQKKMQVLGHILNHGLKILLYGFIFVLFSERADLPGHQVLEHQPVNLPSLFLNLFLQSPDFKKYLVDLPPQFIILFSDLFKLFPGEPPLVYLLLKFENGYGLSVNDRHELRPCLLAGLEIDKGESCFFHLFFQAHEKIPGLFFIGLHNPFFAADIILAFEKPGHLCLQGIHQSVHILSEFPAQAGPLTEEYGHLRIFEIIYIAQVIRHFFLLRGLLEDLFYRCHSA